MTKPRTYTPEQKAEALAMYPEHGAHETARRMEIPVGTVMSWAYRNGVRSQAAERMRAAQEVAHVRYKARMVELQTEVAELGSIRQLEVLANEDAKLYEITGAVTRAIHDVALLSGEATGRVEYTGRDELDTEIAELVAKLRDNDPTPDEVIVQALINGNGHVNGNAQGNGAEHE